MVEARDVSRVFTLPAETVRAVDEVTFLAHAGEFVCVYGPSGSGKSTLLSVISGIDTPDSGTVEVDGVAIAGASARERAEVRRDRVGVVFQHDNLIEEFTVAENVSFPLELRKRESRAQIDADVEQCLSRVDMSGFAERYPLELSGGQQQRVGIARALVGGRRLLVADEPTGALDTENSVAVFRLLRDLCEEGVTVIVSSHDPTARDYAHRTVKMVDGKILED